jgi:hypothetical protein
VPYKLARHHAAQQYITVIIPSPSGDCVDVPATQRMAGDALPPQPGRWRCSRQPARSATFTAKTAEHGLGQSKAARQGRAQRAA